TVAAAHVEQSRDLQRESVEGVRGGAADDGVDVGPRQPRGVERHLRGLEAHLFAGLLEAATEERHARPDDADLPHRPTPRTATAPVALGTNRQDWATPTWTPSTWWVPASPRSWRATSAARWSPVASKTFPHPRDPPEAFTGRGPVRSCSPFDAFRPASPLFASPIASRCCGSL